MHDTFVRTRKSTQLSIEISHLEFTEQLHAYSHKSCNDRIEILRVIEAATREKFRQPPNIYNILSFRLCLFSRYFRSFLRSLVPSIFFLNVFVCIYNCVFYQPHNKCARYTRYLFRRISSPRKHSMQSLKVLISLYLNTNGHIYVTLRVFLSLVFLFTKYISNITFV